MTALHEVLPMQRLLETSNIQWPRPKTFQRVVMMAIKHSSKEYSISVSCLASFESRFYLLHIFSTLLRFPVSSTAAFQKSSFYSICQGSLSSRCDFSSKSNARGCILQSSLSFNSSLSLQWPVRLATFWLSLMVTTLLTQLRMRNRLVCSTK